MKDKVVVGCDVWEFLYGEIVCDLLVTTKKCGT